MPSSSNIRHVDAFLTDGGGRLDLVEHAVDGDADALDGDDASLDDDLFFVQHELDRRPDGARRDDLACFDAFTDQVELLAADRDGLLARRRPRRA